MGEKRRWNVYKRGGQNPFHKDREIGGARRPNGWDLDMVQSQGKERGVTEDSKGGENRDIEAEKRGKKLLSW